MDECNEPEPKPWAITQQHGRNMQKSPSKGESRTKLESKQKQGEGKGKKSAESNKITLPVLGACFLYQWLFDALKFTILLGW